MLIAPKFSLVNVLVDGINVVMNSEDARDIRAKHPEAKVSRLRKNRIAKQLNSTVRIIDPNEYNLGKIVRG